MDWSFTDEQKELRRTVKRFVDEELRPAADEIDKRHEIPRRLIDMMAELGFLGVVFPPEYDGAGMGEMGYVILQEEISRACASTATFIGAHQSIGAVGSAFNCAPVARTPGPERATKFIVSTPSNATPRKMSISAMRSRSLTGPEIESLMGSNPLMARHNAPRGEGWQFD